MAKATTSELLAENTFERLNTAIEATQMIIDMMEPENKESKLEFYVLRHHIRNLENAVMMKRLAEIEL